MLKSYLRFEPKESFGVISSPRCNVAFDPTGNIVYTGANQEICVWNLRQASLVSNNPNNFVLYPKLFYGRTRIEYSFL